MVQYQLVFRGVGIDEVFSSESLAELRKIALQLVSSMEEPVNVPCLDCFHIYRIEELDFEKFVNEEVKQIETL